jgi:hypothetical protein
MSVHMLYARSELHTCWSDFYFICNIRRMQTFPGVNMLHFNSEKKKNLTLRKCNTISKKCWRVICRSAGVDISKCSHKLEFSADCDW